MNCAGRKISSHLVTLYLVGRRRAARQLQIHPIRPTPIISPTQIQRTFTASAAPLTNEESQKPDISEAFQYYRHHSNSLHSLESAIKSRIYSKPAKEEDVIAALVVCKENAGKSRISAHTLQASPTATILSLDDSARPLAIKKAPESTMPSSEATELSRLAYTIISHPTVFLSKSVLDAYVDLAVYIRKISDIPSAFALYAKKPYFRPGAKNLSNTIPFLPKYAVPEEIASKALDAAVAAKSMELALDIISTTYGAPAFRWSKIIRKTIPAGLAVLLSPMACYILAQQAARYLNAADPDLAANYAFAGLLVYIGFTGTIGLVALTTANDQMKRVTWLAGTPLSRRWMYEEERAAYENVAKGWGFEDPNMRYCSKFAVFRRILLTI